MPAEARKEMCIRDRAGAVLGALTAGVLWLDRALAPLLGVIKATPLSSFIILVLLWLTTGMVPVFIAFLIVAPIAWALSLIHI